MTTTNVSSGHPQSGLVASSGDVINVLSGGILTSATILSGGSAVVSVGGVDSGAVVSAGGAELVYGSANGDIIAGSQTVSTGTASGIVTNETVVAGGVVYLSVKSTSASNTTVDTGGLLNINGAISANNTVLNGGEVDLESAKATLVGSLVFDGGTLAVTGNTSAGSGDLAVIAGFAAGDVIDMTTATTIGAATTATFTTATSSGNTVVTVSGGGVSDSYIFSGTSIGATLALVSDGSGGRDLVVSGSITPTTSVGSGTTVSNLVVSSGAPVTVYAGGEIVGATILSGGVATIASGGIDSGAAISAGGSERLLGSASADTVFGSQTISGGAALATNETIASGGLVSLSGGGTAANVTIAGGTVTLETASDTLSGSVDFSGPGTLDLDAVSTSGAGDQAVISGFYTGDLINLGAFGAGATLSTSTSGGNTVATVASGGVSESLTFSGSVASSLTLETSGGVAQIDYARLPTTSSYTPGDLVLSIYGDGSGTGEVSLDQAAPITLEEITQTGQIVSDQELPQTTTVIDGVTEYAISGEYESASEGLLALSGDGQSLTILGYGVSATAFDASDAATVYGTTALGQTTSLLGGEYTAVERVVADISYNGSIDTSTSLSGIFNTNNPRSVYTINGTTFYLSGQGNGTDGTEGVFVADDGASTATAIYNTKTDTREVAIYDSQLFVSVDSKLNDGGGIYNFGTSLPMGETTPAVLPGIGSSIVLTAGQANSVNGAAIGTSVNLSPEQYFFANLTTLYVADGGDPKEGGPGDGGLQKWSLINGSWVLDYTLSTGLNQVADTASDGTTGLVGLTGTVEGGNVVLYASNETVVETDQTYLYGITDSLAATALPTNESFTLLETAAPGTLIRGVAFAPSGSSTVPLVSTTVTVSSGVVSSGLSVTTGGSIIVLNGGGIAGTTLLSGASATISAGGLDSATFVAHGASELVLGSAVLDIIDGAQTLSSATAVVSGEIVENGGALNLFLKGTAASATTVNSGGAIYISGNADATNTVVSGGAIVLESPKAVLAGTLDFIGAGGSIEATAVVSGGYGASAVISGFGAGDVIDERVIGTAATLATSISAGNVLATISSGTVIETFMFAGSGGVSGSAYASGLALVADGSGGVDLIYTPPPPVVIVVSSGVTSSGLSVTSGNGISVLSGGTMSGITVAAGGSAVIAAGGEDSGTTIQAGGTETVSGDASGDQIYGSQIVTSGGSAATIPATVENETVFNGGTVELYLKPDVGTGITVSSGGSLLLSGNVSATNTTLDAGAFMALQSPKAVFNGTLTFSGTATIDVTAVTSAGFGGLGVISGWGAGDVIDETLISSTVATLTTTTSGGNTVETVSGATYPDSFIFEGTDEAAHVALVPDGGSGVELIYVTCFFPGTRIATPGGETVVEELQPGDLVWLADGGVAPVRWVGVQTISRTFADPARVLPVRIRAGALDGTLPTRDLLVSPGHALLLDGTLAQAGTLVGFDGITREYATTDTFRYYHIELDAHALLLAEGVAAESYLPLAEDVAFDNRAERPASPMMVEMPYPRAKAPRQLPQALRARLARRTAA